MKRKLIVGFLTLCSIATVCPSVYASTDHYTDSSVTGADSGWSDWDANWADTAADFTKVSLTPGADDTQLNFAWYSEKSDSAATPVVHFGTDKDNLETFEGTAGDVDQELTGDKAYEYNHVTVTGLEPETTYYYIVEKNGQQTDVCEYKTQKTDTVKMLYVGDPQIGASKGQTQNGAELTNESGAANTAAENDGFSWNRTLNTALSENPDVNFVISAGDQVNKTGEAKEEEYASYLSADALKSGISGYNVSDIETLMTLWNTNRIQVGGLLFSGLLISCLGAVMDVAMSISSAIDEIYKQNTALSRKELFKAGMRVGRDMMGTDSNTLILAFAGSSVSTLLLDYAYDLPYQQIINSNNIGIAIMQGLAGSFGIVLSVPLTVLICTVLFHKNETASQR